MAFRPDLRYPPQHGSIGFSTGFDAVHGCRSIGTLHRLHQTSRLASAGAGLQRLQRGQTIISRRGGTNQNLR